MIVRGVRPLVTMAVGMLLVVMAFANAGSVGAAIPDRTFQVMGCDIGDYTCYYHKIGGAPETYVCNAGYYTCANGVPIGQQQQQDSPDVSPYCGDGGRTGCLAGSPLFVSTTTASTNANGLSAHVIVAGNIVKNGSSGPHVVVDP